jgi:predicted AlkP superfamily pyrophosphatase or phosphodiesterase
MPSSRLGRRAFTIGLGASTLAGCVSTPVPDSPARLGARRVIVISIDGLRPEYLRDADSMGLRTPNLRRLRAAGASADGVVSVWPSVTYPAHTTMVTGVRPARHGIATNYPFDPLRTTQGAWMWFAEAITARTLWTAAHEAGMTSGAVYWPVTVGAAIDWNLPQIWRTKTDHDDQMLRALSTPGMARAMEKAVGQLPAEHRSDAVRAKGAAWVVREKKPNLMLAYLTDLDSVQHEHGPFTPAARATLELIDDGVGQIVEAARTAGTLDATTFVIVSDHGFLPVTRMVRPYVLLAREGLVELENKVVKAWRAAPIPCGGTCGIVLASPGDDSLRARVGDVLAKAAADPTMGIRKVHTEAEMTPRGGFPGAAFVLEAETGWEYSWSTDGPVVGPSDHGGTHGYPPERSEMHASLVLSGAGVKKGASLGVVQLTDVAPTIAKMLGLSMPDVEGSVLGAALG